MSHFYCKLGKWRCLLWKKENQVSQRSYCLAWNDSQNLLYLTGRFNLMSPCNHLICVCLSVSLWVPGSMCVYERERERKGKNYREGSHKDMGIVIQKFVESSALLRDSGFMSSDSWLRCICRPNGNGDHYGHSVNSQSHLNDACEESALQPAWHEVQQI